MWWLIFNRFKPQSFLEIGVYRGQTISLASFLQRQLSISGTVAGVSPFTAAGDSVSRYKGGIDYLEDTKANFAHFRLPEPMLFPAYSTAPEAVEFIRSRLWDCIYIDGNHEYEVALSDWKVCAENVKLGGLVVLDDASLGTNYQPPIFATGGHPGPSRVAAEIDPSKFKEVLRVGHNRVFQRLI
jgi:hypothetical protein